MFELMDLYFVGVMGFLLVVFWWLIFGGGNKRQDQK